MPTFRQRLWAALAVLLVQPLPVLADPPPEVIPAPRPLSEPQPLLPPPLPYHLTPQPPVRPQFGQMSVWQFFGRDRTGHFRPLVIQGPSHSYYRYDHSPYPWLGNHTQHFMPYVVD
jgi:hypothetical protein